MSFETDQLRKIVAEIRLNAERDYAEGEEAFIYWVGTEMDLAKRIERLVDLLEAREIGL